MPPVQLHGDHLAAEALAVLREVVDVRLARATHAARGDVVRVGLVARTGERDDRVVPRAHHEDVSDGHPFTVCPDRRHSSWPAITSSSLSNGLSDTTPYLPEAEIPAQPIVQSVSPQPRRADERETVGRDVDLLVGVRRARMPADPPIEGSWSTSWTSVGRFCRRG